VPLQPDIVKSKLDVRLRTPTPAALKEALWKARTPSSVRELEAQLTLIRDHVRRHKSSSLASIIEAINLLKKGAEVMMLSAELMRDRITSLERANETATKRRSRKKKRVQKQGITRLPGTLSSSTNVTMVTTETELGQIHDVCSSML
jgi:hypothetical protein